MKHVRRNAPLEKFTGYGIGKCVLIEKGYFWDRINDDETPKPEMKVSWFVFMHFNDIGNVDLPKEYATEQDAVYAQKRREHLFSAISTANDDVRIGDLTEDDYHKRNPTYCSFCGGQCLFDDDGELIEEK